MVVEQVGVATADGRGREVLRGVVKQRQDGQVAHQDVLGLAVEFVARGPVAFVERMVNIDGEDSMALVGVTESTGRPQFIGVARYGRNPDGESAEFAIAVNDAWQRRGVAAQLMQALADYAKRHGIGRFEGEVLAANERMLDLCRWLKFDLQRSPEGGHVMIASRRL